MSSISDDTSPLTQIEIDQRVFDLYDEYCHGRIDRREFLPQAAAVTAGGLAMAQALLPRYARRRRSPSPIRASRRATSAIPRPAARPALCAAISCSPPATGRSRPCSSSTRTAASIPTSRMSRGAPRPRASWRSRPMASPPSAAIPATTTTAARCRLASISPSCAPICSTARAISTRTQLSTGKLGVTGFCWGGSTTNYLAVTLGADMHAGVPFYGAAAETSGVPSIKAPLLIHYAENDERINAMWPAFETALKAAGVRTRCTSTQARSTASTTTRRRASMSRPPSSPGTVPLRTSRSTSREGRLIGRSPESSGHPEARRHHCCCWTGQRRLPLQAAVLR